eukprot:TRINITY_DN12231_c0_g1_i1.p2 TRINITY_DN12231_c0_g1~~TRINITY_DN12231_c0_g1_i1.p2  ORF type:complete len:113 (+),score=26.65 TRINITY_DN12231_c0_g1_i1:136-474(+)
MLALSRMVSRARALPQTVLMGPIAGARSITGGSPMIPEERFYPAWVDAILNRENATGPRRKRHAKRMHLRQLQRENNHKRRIAETKASVEAKKDKNYHQKQAGLQWKLNFST